MKKVLAQIIAGVVVLIIGTLVGVFVQKYRSEAEGKIRFLDVEVNKGESILSAPTIPGKNIQITLEGKPIDSLSEATISIFNFTDRDFSEVPVYIELIPQSPTPIAVVGQQAVGENDLPEAIEPIPNVCPSNTKGALRYGYKIKNVNRSSQFVSGALQVRFLFLGQEVPEVKVVTDKIGLKLQGFSYQHLETQSLTYTIQIITMSALVIVTYFLVFLFTIKFARNKQLKSDLKLQQNLQVSLDNENIQADLGISPNKSGAIAMYAVKFFQKYRWDNTPKLLRFISAFSKPETKKTATVGNQQNEE